MWDFYRPLIYCVVYWLERLILYWEYNRHLCLRWKLNFECRTVIVMTAYACKKILDTCAIPEGKRLVEPPWLIPVYCGFPCKCFSHYSLSEGLSESSDLNEPKKFQASLDLQIAIMWFPVTASISQQGWVLCWNFIEW